MFAKPLAFAALFLSFSSSYSSPKSLELNEFVKAYLMQDEALIQTRLDLKNFEENLRVARDLSQLDLSLTPKTTHVDQEIETTNTETYTRTDVLEASLTQDLPIGSKLSISSTDLGNRSRSDLSVSYTQSLWRDAFGAQSRSLIRSAEKDLSSSQKIYKNQLNASCIAGANIFIDAFINQERAQTFEKILQSSEKVYSATHSSYKRQLVDRIDDLSAEADLIRTRSLYQESIGAQKKSWQELQIHIEAVSAKNMTQTYALSDPHQNLRLSSSGEGLVKSNLELMSLQDSVLSFKERLESAKHDRRSDLQLILQATDSRGVASSQRFNSETYLLSLKWDLPVINKTLDARVVQAKVAVEKAQQTWNAKLRELNQSWHALQVDIDLFQQLKKMSEKRIELFQKQAKAARRKLRSGKMEVEDYLVIRDNYLNEQLNYLGLQQQRWKSLLQRAAIENAMPEYCQL